MKTAKQLEKELNELDAIADYINGRRRAINIELNRLAGIQRPIDHQKLTFAACAGYAVLLTIAIITVAIVGVS